MTTNAGNMRLAKEQGKDLPRTQGKSKPIRKKKHGKLVLFLLVLCFVVVLLWDFVVISTLPGEQGIYWSRFFGGTSDMELGEGTHLKFPWDEIFVYSMRVNEIHGNSMMLTKDGMEIHVDWSVRYALNPRGLPKLHSTVGPAYKDKIIVPESVSTMRQILGNYTADQIYSRDELSLLNEIQERIRSRVGVYPILIDRVLILRLDLPKDMSAGIIEKLLSEQRMLSYNYRLQNEKSERQRKIIEADGIREFEKISKVSILKWRGIEATTEMAKSPNSKIIVMGTGANGMPILLNSDK